MRITAHCLIDINDTVRHSDGYYPAEQAIILTVYLTYSVCLYPREFSAAMYYFWHCQVK
jgi:hypothetical protein